MALPYLWLVQVLLDEGLVCGWLIDWLNSWIIGGFIGWATF